MTLVAERLRDGDSWLEHPGFGVYVHVPFCLHRCHYCDFNTYAKQDALHNTYVSAVIADIERCAPECPATSVFFGGGTPTLLPPGQLAAILDSVRAAIGIASGAEITVEANPETVDEGAFEALLSAGFNRFSVGVQSLVTHVLMGLGRTHSAERAVAALRAARRAGVTNLNADLIYGSPWARPGDWEVTLDGVAAEAPEHISAYALTVEEGTPLATLVATGRVPEVDPDLQADRFEAAQAQLAEAGYERYEVSNWARPSRAARHNLLYWSAGDYLGFGAGAHSHRAGRRWWSLRRPHDYIDAVERDLATIAGYEDLDAHGRAGEALVLGLRLRDGVDREGFARRFGASALEDREVAIEGLVDQGVLELDGGRLRVAPSAVLLTNDIACRLL
jgi:putative oxygen-independent coproporphyrinogen III oxidase